MRVRFSIRLLLLVVALFAAALYVVLVRPTNVAQKFVDAVNQQDINTTRSLLINPDSWPIRADSASGPETIKRLYAELVPREWSDIWALQRRGLLRVIHRDERDGRRIDWAADFDVVAYVRGVEIDAVFVDL